MSDLNNDIEEVIKNLKLSEKKIVKQYISSIDR